MSGSSIIYYYYTVVLELVGITDTTVQTGIGAGLSMWTWVIQIAAVFVGKRVGKKTILLWIWPLLLVSLAGLCATSGVFANSANGNTSAGIGACVAFTRAKRPALIADSCLTPCSVALVWIYLGFFNFASAPPSFRFQPLERSLISTCVSPQTRSSIPVRSVHVGLLTPADSPDPLPSPTGQTPPRFRHTRSAARACSSGTRPTSASASIAPTSTQSPSTRSVRPVIDHPYKVFLPDGA
jgi:hypothetical protein